MDRLSDIVTALDAALASTPLARFYDIRKQLKGRGKNWSSLLLAKDDDKSRAGYAFHNGGREELQFNVGFEDDGAYFRYGVAFSLEPGRTLSDPLAVLAPKIERFNRVIARFPELTSLKMWRRDPDGQRLFQPVGPIPNAWERNGAFIFLGERMRTPEGGVTPAMVARAAQVLNMLLPLYRRVEDETGNVAPEYRVARLCWNTKLWQQPSGLQGKSRDADAFEAKIGFGHEEWLFDLGTLIDGWKYGFVQALNHSHAKYEGQQLGLLLYTIDGKTKRRFWVGAIDEVTVLTHDQARDASREMRQRGWLKAMREQVEALGFDPATLDSVEPLDHVNVRFQPEALRLFDPPVPFPREALPSNYYGTLQRVPPSQLEILDRGEAASRLIERNLGALKTTRRVYESTKEFDRVQAQWQERLRKTLPEDLPAGTEIAIETEIDGHRPDGVIGTGPERIFVELKARGTVRYVIRDALSQLMEYAYWPNKKRCETLLIVGPFEAGAEDQEYLAMLRQRFDLPVYYLHYREGHIVGIAEWFRSLPKRAAVQPVTAARKAAEGAKKMRQAVAEES